VKLSNETITELTGELLGKTPLPLEKTIVVTALEGLSDTAKRELAAALLGSCLIAAETQGAPSPCPDCNLDLDGCPKHDL
jgi:hypothetical protein